MLQDYEHINYNLSNLLFTKEFSDQEEETHFLI